MCKKFLVTGLLVVGAVAFLRSERGQNFVAKIRTRAGCCSQSSDLEREVSRLRSSLRRLQHEDRTDVHKLAVKEQQVDKLRIQIKGLEEVASGKKKVILTLREDLKKGEQLIQYGGQEYTSERVKRHVSRVFSGYKRDIEELNSLRMKLEEEEKVLQAAHDTMKAKQNQRRDLEIRLIRLETKLHRVRREQMRRPLVINKSSQQSKIKARIEKLEDRVDLEARKFRLENEHFGKLPVDHLEDPIPADVLKEIDQHFGKDNVADRD